MNVTVTQIGRARFQPCRNKTTTNPALAAGVRSLVLCTGLIVFSTVASVPAFAQGCAQCKDSVEGTPVRTQTAYRHAIEILAGAGVAVFIGGALLMRSNRYTPE